MHRPVPLTEPGPASRVPQLVELGLLSRLALLGLALVLEKQILGRAIDFDRAQAAHGVGAVFFWAYHRGQFVLTAFLGTLVAFALARSGRDVAAVSARMSTAPIRPLPLAVHALLLALLLPLCRMAYAPGLPSTTQGLLLGLIVLLALLAILMVLAAASPLKLWAQLASCARPVWPYALASATIALVAWHWSQALWAPTARLTFILAQPLLRPLIPSLEIDAAQQLFITDSFGVRIDELCSGLEGMGLMVAFVAAWLAAFRQEYRFPRALLLLPAGALAMFALNILRITLLVLIGYYVSPEVAEHGFHSQAGWILFIAAACMLVWSSRRVAWLCPGASLPKPLERAANPAASYLLPLLTLLGAGMVAKAASGGFETLYPLRLIAGGAALILCRKGWRSLDWSCSWRGLLGGVLIGTLWLGYSRLLQRAQPMPQALSDLPDAGRVLWISCRALCATIVVPIAEELAYRGFLQRRLMAVDFESVAFGAVRWPAILISSIAFGAVHGLFWPVGILAGVLFGLISVRTGRIGEAVVAHAISNLIIAIAVLVFGAWQLW